MPRTSASLAAPKPRLAARPDIGQLDGTVVLCIDNECAILDGMETLLSGWNCRTLTATDLAQALAMINASGAEPDGLLVDYHLDDSNGISAIAAFTTTSAGSGWATNLSAAASVQSDQAIPASTSAGGEPVRIAKSR